MISAPLYVVRLLAALVVLVGAAGVVVSMQVSEWADAGGVRRFYQLAVAAGARRSPRCSGFSLRSHGSGARAARATQLFFTTSSQRGHARSVNGLSHSAQF